MAEEPLLPPDPSGRVDQPKSAERALLEERLARLTARRAASAPRAGATSNTAPAGRQMRSGGGRRHPAARARVAALGLSVLSTGGLVALFATGKSAGATGTASAASIVRSGAVSTGQVQTQSSSTAATQSAPATTQSPPATTATQSAPATTATTAAPTTTAATSTVVDGAVYSNRWGDVQVEATFDSSGALVDVVALQTPNDRGKSIEINDYAVPQLTSEALGAQSASIDSISGATYTSHDYMRSLQSAIDVARAAGVTAIA
jgi:uncharacterized protein with FMN-binding domain